MAAVTLHLFLFLVFSFWIRSSIEKKLTAQIDGMPMVNYQLETIEKDAQAAQAGLQVAHLQPVVNI